MRVKRSYVQVLPGSAATIRSITAGEEDVARHPKVDKEIEALLALAVEQGWDVKPHGTGLKWLHPDGVQMVNTPLRVIGRGHLNIRTELQKKGLDISSLAPTRKNRDEPLSTKEMATIAADDDMPKTSAAVQDATDHLNAFAQSEDFDPALAQYLNDAVGSMKRFVTTLGLSQCDHSELQTEIDKVTQESLDLLGENEKLQSRVTTLEAQLSRVGTELKEALLQRDANLERANRFEKKVRDFRNALSLDD